MHHDKDLDELYEKAKWGDEHALLTLVDVLRAQGDQRKKVDRAISQYPHCDMHILHSPGECVYCDKHPDWQKLRIDWGINFTGQNHPNRTPCPAEQRRDVDIINRWGGNRAAGPDYINGG